MNPDAKPRSRPSWAHALDRWALRMARVLGRTVPRPSEQLLAQLSPRDSRPDELGGVIAGRRALEAGQLAEALHQFSQLLQVDPQASWAWHGRGDALQLMGDATGALAAYSKASELAPQVGLHHSGQANALASLGRAEDARTAHARALHLDPTLTWVQDPEAARAPLGR